MPTLFRAFTALAFWMAAGSAHSQPFGESPQRDIEQGVEAAKMAAQQIGLCSLLTEAYVRDVGGRLVAVVNHQRWKFSFQIVDQAEPNAFAVRGDLYVSRGLLALINREDEPAGVMGHEIAHVTQRHLARQPRQASCPDCSPSR